MALLRFHATVLALGLSFAGCDAPPGSVARRTEPVTYEARGVLREVWPERRKAVIAHEDIPGFMAAMTMEFTAAESREFAGLAPGDVVSFRLTVTEESSWIDQVRKTGTAPIPAAAEPAAAFTPGSLVQDCALVDSSGGAFRLSDFRGRALALTFIFTRCPLPDFCPRLNKNFAAVQRLLAARPDRSWHLLSISLDPDYDTPARLAEYAPRYAPDPALWSFATGQPDDIEKLGASLGLRVVRTGELPEHNLRTVVIGPDGRVRHVFTGNEWTPEDLAVELECAMTAAP